jgi:hypothetical protein
MFLEVTLVPSGKNYIIKNIKGKDFVVIKNLEGQNKETLVNSILADHFADVGFRKIILIFSPLVLSPPK